MSRAERVGIVGAGRFGTALGNVIARQGRDVLMWSTAPDVVESMNSARRNPRLPDVELADGLRATSDGAELAREARFLVVAVGSTQVRDRALALGDVIDGSHLVVHAIGAFASPGDQRVSTVLERETAALRIGVLAGPALPSDLVEHRFASMVVASRFDEVTAEARRLLGGSEMLRLYRASDLVGVELAAALTGAYTLALGMADALGLGPGPRAVMVTRVVAEATRLVEAAGGSARTFSGLAGLGNLLVRSTSEARRLSLDYALGQEVGLGETRPGNRVTEGARASAAAVRLARDLGVRVPLLDATNAVLTGNLSPRQAAQAVAESVAQQE